MPTQHNRLLLEFNDAVAQTNREILNPVIPDLTIAELKVVMERVALARAAYLKCFFAIGQFDADKEIQSSDLKELKLARETYEELLAGAQALEQAIGRQYLDVKS